VPVRASVDYAQANALERAAEVRAWSVRASYGAEVELTVFVPVAEVDPALAMFAHLTASQAHPNVGDVEWA
ncbi:DUF1949 domain-containing protein, partial [Geobacillus sp. MMMUD3]|nr:DUF1949 domain-containing protein [Geobacillus sp. MMMUD3]